MIQKVYDARDKSIYHKGFEDGLCIAQKLCARNGLLHALDLLFEFTERWRSEQVVREAGKLGPANFAPLSEIPLFYAFRDAGRPWDQ